MTEKTEMKETMVEKKSDINKLFDEANYLKEMLGEFNKIFDELHSKVFKNKFKEQLEDSPKPEPQNLIEEVRDIVFDCKELQRSNRQIFNEFDNLLSR